ncbi:hypothetical protein CUC08_Gglean004228 [Alternaria sp. MG1]|nr:hypothetical protein CUC08_Gglean004228 [Alternaria sp. MG1]
MTAICRRLIRPGGAWYGIPRRTLTTLLGVEAKAKGCDAVQTVHQLWEGRGCIRFQRTGRMIICLSGVCVRAKRVEGMLRVTTVPTVPTSGPVTDRERAWMGRERDAWKGQGDGKQPVSARIPFRQSVTAIMVTGKSLV